MKEDISRLNRYRSEYFKLGLCISLCLVLLAFNYSHQSSESLHFNPVALDSLELLEVVRTKHEIKRSKVPKKVIQELLEPKEEIIFEDPEVREPEIIESVLAVDTSASQSKPVSKGSIPSKKAVKIELPPAEEDNEIYIRVHQMPQFGDCSSANTEEERIACSNKNLLSFIYANTKYPRIAVENEIEGTVVVQFIIDKIGKVTSVKVMRDIGGGCGKEALRVIKSMPNWTPGVQGIHKVKVKYNLPVKFTLRK